MHLEFKCAHLVIFTNFVDECSSSSHVNEWISHIAFFPFFPNILYAVCWISFQKTQRACDGSNTFEMETIFRVNNCDVFRYRYVSKYAHCLYVFVYAIRINASSHILVVYTNYKCTYHSIEVLYSRGEFIRMNSLRIFQLLHGIWRVSV